MDIANFISNVGFPIACCIYMGVYLQNTIKVMAQAIENNTEAIRELREELKQRGEKNEQSN